MIIYKCIILISILIVLFSYLPIYIKNYYVTNYIEYRYIDHNKPLNPLYIVKNPNINVNDTNIIPNYLFQTYYDKSKIPKYIFDAIQLYAKNYKYFLLDDTEAIQFLNTYFIKDVVDRFKNLSYGAHKADLLRYCLLYIYGGIYIDIKTILIQPLDDIFVNKTYFYTAASKFVNKNNLESYIYQGILASPPKNKIFLNLINFITYLPLYIMNSPFKIFYLLLIEHFYQEILQDIQINNKNIKKLNFGINIGKMNTYYLFEESCSDKNIDKYNNNNACSKLDRYGFCCNIYDQNNKIFIGRDPNFPWK